MKKILAVSGGIDSVVMLHYLKNDAEPPVVAHFDHGIRGNSAEDAAFVEGLAKKYGLEYEVCHAKLGEGCSEADARSARYDFFAKIAAKYHGIICVAHHSDDVIESIAINILRGTGWRGLAPMSAKNIERPLLTWSKKDIYRYAAEHQLSFRQDQTNTEDVYLRNRVREALIGVSDDTKKRLLDLYKKQCILLAECEELLNEIFPEQTDYYSRNLALEDENVAIELLRFVLARHGISQTRPQLKKCRDAIKNFTPGKRFSLNRDHFLVVGKYTFAVL